jgi:hypothetical protein
VAARVPPLDHRDEEEQISQLRNCDIHPSASAPPSSMCAGTGGPSCVGSAIPPGNLGELDSAVRGRIPDKRAAAALLDALLRHTQ